MFCLKPTIQMNIEDQQFILNMLKEKVDIQNKKIYTFSHYNVKDLEQNHYLLSFKTNGSKFFLILTTIKGIKYSVFVQYDNPHNLKIFNVKLRFDKNLYNLPFYNKHSQ